MIYLGSDHAGFLVKEAIKDYLTKHNIPYVDYGTDSLKSVDYQDYAFKVAESVIKDKNNKGILVCGTGMGICIAANKVDGIIAGLVDRKELTEYVVSHDHANILCLSGRYVSVQDNIDIVDKFLHTEPLHDYHERRVDAILEYEKNKYKD